FAQLTIERLAHDGLGTIGFVRRDREADRMLRAALGDQDDGDTVIAQRPEQSMRSARHAYHPGALEVHERNAVDRRDALHHELRGGLLANERARLLGCKRVADPDRDALRD